MAERGFSTPCRSVFEPMANRSPPPEDIWIKAKPGRDQSFPALAGGVVPARFSCASRQVM